MVCWGVSRQRPLTSHTDFGRGQRVEAKRRLLSGPGTMSPMAGQAPTSCPAARVNDRLSAATDGRTLLAGNAGDDTLNVKRGPRRYDRWARQ